MTITRQNLFGKLDVTLFRSIESATTICKLRGNPYVELVHWLNQLWQQDESDFRIIMRHFDVDIELLERGFAQALTRLPSGASSISDFSYHIELAIERAWIYASLECYEGRIRSGHLLIAMLTTMELRRALFDISSAFERISLEHLTNDFSYITQASVEVSEVANDGSTPGEGAIPGEASNALGAQKTGAGLAQYTTDLTALAREGKIDPVLGRDHEINTMIDILLRRRQNNPLLTGEAGVGKTAVVEGLAQSIVAGKVPPVLSKVRLLTLDVVALSAGASMKGEFEARLKSVLEEAVASPQPVILFIDEVHTLVGAGGAAGTGDAANLLKPALARGQLRTIGATTWGEFKRHIEKDPALTRRFQVLQINEPDEKMSISMLRGLIPMLEKHHGVWITDEAIQAAVRLSHRYIPARQLPDKAISLLDTACARVAVAQHAPPGELQILKFQAETAQTELSLVEKALHFGKGENDRSKSLQEHIALQTEKAALLDKRWQQEKEIVSSIIAVRQELEILIAQDAPDRDAISELQSKLSLLEASLLDIRQEKPMVMAEVNADVIASIVADWTGIPVGQMMKDDIRAVLELPQRLTERVIGQEFALNQVSESIQTARAGLADPKKPIGVFMLVGPSGVGKTETALAIAEQLYGGEQNLITINMSEYQEAHTVSSLKGSPPGYVGYGEGGVLTEAVRRKPYSVILLDEIEKAHPDVHELFFQVFDKGSMEDGEGRQIDFKNTILLLTSNAGSEMMSSLFADPDTAPDAASLKKMLQPELLKVFPAAFLGRLGVVPYVPLHPESLQHIVRLHLDRLGARLLEQHDAHLSYKDKLVHFIVEQCPVAETGARMLIRFIEQNIVPEMGRHILSSEIPIAGQTVEVDVDKENRINIVFNKRRLKKSNKN
ncbi:type VI secretion system ATPase TssH [Erwinia tracheiphila]|uniref:Type VI secretion system ATPase TssH n=1 Tax=Erwinia tracheiphila TaxID=65700 RepID=A0A345CVY9_9GAMM|nr:type VI secretion system ATPase TssH [Erwinia tracheiphila]AXF77606.1 type VI secretion system ATPase TssH [Erwinia tracheiphila]EOS94466.1 type VI secretion ATPase [Erwinia tracheiphila PSU-1]UIA83711.1 type VI secretion system ATPase TssH [Erwinia tracheiphila]UIA88114.1 type VI secretion system ATPase TssH [Erwinia tracheiphila]UIA92293.1 type VI secretion system ATPase TssH [Erwinia tracheiphila]